MKIYKIEKTSTNIIGTKDSARIIADFYLLDCKKNFRLISSADDEGIL